MADNFYPRASSPARAVGEPTPPDEELRDGYRKPTILTAAKALVEYAEGRARHPLGYSALEDELKALCYADLSPKAASTWREDAMAARAEVSRLTKERDDVKRGVDFLRSEVARLQEELAQEKEGLRQANACVKATLQERDEARAQLGIVARGCIGVLRNALALQPAGSPNAVAMQAAIESYEKLIHPPGQAGAEAAVGASGEATDCISTAPEGARCSVCNSEMDADGKTPCEYCDLRRERDALWEELKAVQTQWGHERAARRTDAEQRLALIRDLVAVVAKGAE